jgi:SAM-dependent methyltransferase
MPLSGCVGRRSSLEVTATMSTSRTEEERIRAVYRAYSSSERWAARCRPNAGTDANEGAWWECLERALAEAGLLPLAGRPLLEIGSGSGRQLARMREWGARDEALFGVDLLEERVAMGQRDYPRMRLSQGNAARLSFPDGSFDLVALFMVMSSVLDGGVRAAIAREAARVLAPGGAVLWYDLRWPKTTNPHVRGVTRRELGALFPGFRHALRPATLLPPLARRLGRATAALYPALSAVPAFLTHSCGLLAR